MRDEKISSITIITPTYNRANLLSVVFESLQNQTSNDFEWLIVDDGSNDCTRQCVEKMSKSARFSIHYLLKDNGGKHTALNAGIEVIKTRLTIIVDSDDQLLPDAIETILLFAKKYENRIDIGVLSFLKCSGDGKIIVSAPSDEMVASYIDCRIKGNKPGDMAEVFYTSVLKQNPFPVFQGERFLSEDVAWIDIGKKYLFVFINKVIYQCDYHKDGLTANDKQLKFSSPLGSMLRGKRLMSRECGLKANIRGSIIYNCYHQQVHDKLPEILELTENRAKILTKLTWPLTKAFIIWWKMDRKIV